MLKFLTVIKGYILIRYLRRKAGEYKIILFLTGENERVDHYALVYLKYILERKHFSGVLLVIDSMERISSIKKDLPVDIDAQIIRLSSRKIENIFQCYRVMNADKNLYFTYTDKSKDNKVGRYIRETEIDEIDTVCLAIYNLRKVPQEV